MLTPAAKRGEMHATLYGDLSTILGWAGSGGRCTAAARQHRQCGWTWIGLPGGGPGDLASAPTSRPEKANLERLKPHHARRLAVRNAVGAAPAGIYAAGIVTARVSC